MTDHMVQLGFAILSLFATLISFIFKRERDQLKADIAAIEKQRVQDIEDRDKARKEEMERIERVRQEDLRNHEKEVLRLIASMEERADRSAKINQDLWDELKEYRADRRRHDEETWKQINGLKDRQVALELQLVKSYHTKDDFNKLFDDKLGPIISMVKDIKGQVGARRHTDNT